MIPPTIVTNDPDLLREFESTYRDGVICKPIYQGLVSQGGERYAVYTRQVESDELCDDEQLRACPTLLQKRVPKGTDIRVTFIGREVFAVEIDSPDTKPLDWRRPGEHLRYRSVKIPAGIEIAVGSFFEVFVYRMEHSILFDLLMATYSSSR